MTSFLKFLMVGVIIIQLDMMVLSDLEDLQALRMGKENYYIVVVGGKLDYIK